MQHGATPATLQLARKKEHVVKIALDGYQPHEVALKHRINGWFWGNLILGGIIGMVVDLTTGSIYRLTPNQIDAMLTPENVNLGTLENDALYITVTLTPDPA